MQPSPIRKRDLADFLNTFMLYEASLRFVEMHNVFPDLLQLFLKYVQTNEIDPILWKNFQDRLAAWKAQGLLPMEINPKE